MDCTGPHDMLAPVSGPVVQLSISQGRQRQRQLDCRGDAAVLISDARLYGQHMTCCLPLSLP